MLVSKLPELEPPTSELPVPPVLVELSSLGAEEEEVVVVVLAVVDVVVVVVVVDVVLALEVDPVPSTGSSAVSELLPNTDGPSVRGAPTHPGSETAMQGSASQIEMRRMTREFRSTRRAMTEQPEVRVVGAQTGSQASRNRKRPFPCRSRPNPLDRRKDRFRFRFDDPRRGSTDVFGAGDSDAGLDRPLH